MPPSHFPKPLLFSPRERRQLKGGSEEGIGEGEEEWKGGKKQDLEKSFQRIPWEEEEDEGWSQ